MKVKCSKCKHVINVSDDKLEGKEGKIKLRCPSCKTALAVKLPSKTGAASEGEPVWYYSLDGNQEGPVSVEVMKSLIMDGKLHGNSDVWRPGLDAWVKASVLPELFEGTGKSAALEAPVAGSNELFMEKTMEIDSVAPDQLPKMEELAAAADSMQAEEPKAEYDPAKAALERSRAYLAKSAETYAAAPAAPKEPDDGDIFGGFDAGGEAEDGDFEAQDDAPANLAHTRRETSVLFSIDDAIGGKKGKKKKRSPDGGSTVDSGLIDIRQMGVGKQEDDIFASFSGGSVSSSLDESSVIAGGKGASIATTAINVPILKRKKKWPFVVAAVAVGLLLVVGGGGFYWAFHAYFGTGSPKWLEGQLRTLHTNALNESTNLAKKSGEELQAQKDAKLKEIDTKLDAARKAHETRVASLEADFRSLRDEEVKAFETEREALDKRRSELQEKLGALANKKQEVVVVKEVAIEPKKVEPEDGGTKEAANPTQDDQNTKKATNDSGSKKQGSGSKTSGNEKAKTPEKEKAKEPEKEKAGTGGGTQAAKEPAKTEEKKKTGNEADDILKKVDGGGEKVVQADTAQLRPLSNTDITKVVGENKGKFRDCYDRYGGGLQPSTIRTRVTISPSGDVSSVVVSSAEFAGTALGNCVRDALKNAKFPAFGGNAVTKPVSVRVP